METSTPEVEDFSQDLHDYQGDVLDVRQSTWDFLWHRHPAFAFATFVVPVCFSLAIAYFEFMLNGTVLATREVGQIEALFLVAPLFIPWGTYRVVQSRMQLLFYTEIAQKLNLSYSAYGELPTTNARLFAFGYAQKVTNVLSGLYKGVPMRLFNYEYTTGSGKNKTTHYYSVAELTTTGILPEIMVTPHSIMAFFQALDSWRPAGTQELSLEGDFNKKFTVYVPEGKEVEALQILEPTVMEKLMDGFDTFGFECVGNCVYLFTKGELSENRTRMLSLYALLERFYSTLLPELASFTNTGLKP